MRVFVESDRWSAELREERGGAVLVIRGQQSGCEMRWSLGSAMDNAGMELRDLVNTIAALDRAASVQRIGVFP
jgi:hypothetical protein